MQQALLGIENRKPKPIPVPPRLAVKGGQTGAISPSCVAAKGQ